MKRIFTLRKTSIVKNVALIIALFLSLMVSQEFKAQVLLTESFDGTTFVPAGWTNVVTSGTKTWTRVTTGTFPTQGPQSGAGEAKFNSWNANGGVRSMVTPALNFSIAGTKQVSFWMYRDNGYTGNADRVDVLINTVASPTGATTLGTVNRATNLAPTVGANGWYQYTYTVPTFFNTATNYILFRGTSTYGNNIYVDNIQVINLAVCSGAPNGGTTVSSLNPVCSGVNFTLSTTGSSVGSGITYQWQSSPDNVTWTNITGATSATLVTNTTAAKYYRLAVLCTNSGLTSYSTSLYETINGGGPCACLTYPSSSATSTADDEIFNVTFGSLSNSSSCGVAAPGPGSAASMYSNYAGYLTAPNMYKGTSYPLSVTVGMCGGFSYQGVVTVYIDYNANGVFTDAGELVYTSPYTFFAVGGTTVSTTVNIPMTAAVGIVRMRVIEVESSFGAASTGTYTWGETEDYCINILAPPPCSGTPAPGNTLTSSSAVGSGQTVNLSLQNNTIGTGVTYQWQTASSSTGPWTNVAGQTNSTYTATITALSYFQCIVTCTGNTTISNPVLVSVIACIPAGSTTYYLTNVNTVGASTNFTNVTGASAGGYGNYYSTIGASAYQGSSFTINMNSIYSSDYFQLWIDWNNDLDFADAGESVYNSNAYVASGSTVVNVAGAQAVGTYRMRVSNGYLGATTACGPNSWGEFEDYKLTVLAVPLPTITSIPASGCPAVSVTITGTGLNTVSAVQFGGVNASSFTIVNSTTINAIPGTGASGPITVSNMTGTATSSTSFSLGSQPATPIITPSQSQFCGTGGSVTLNASGSSGTYTWTSLEGSPSLSGTTGTSITAGITQTSAVQVQTLDNGCYSLPAIQSIGLYPLPTANLTTSANGVCPGTSATINTGLSAGNFTAACANLTPFTIPSGAAYLCNNGAAVAGLASGSLDDGGWSAIPIGFSYNFFGTNYTTINVGTNGVLQFGAYNATALGDFIIGALPNTVDPLGAIYAGSNDLHCGYVGSNTYIRYWTNGYAPNRRFIVEYYVNQYAYSTRYQKFQVILYETTGLVGIIGLQTQSTNAKSIGVNSPSGTIGAAAPNCAVTPNTVNYWSGTTAQIAVSAPQSWIFTPPTNYTTVWTGNGSALPAPAVSSGTNIFTQNVTPAITTLYNISYTNQTTGCTNAPGSAQVTMTILDNIAPSGVNAQASVSGVCSGTNFTLSFLNPPSPDGLSYQWQVSTDNGATWSNILGATAATASVNQSVTSLYRCMLTKCSGTAGYSSTVTVLTNGAVWQSTFVSMNTGSSNWCVGEVRTVSITLTNTGTATWTNAAPDINVGIKWNGDLDYFIRVDANGLVSGATQTYYLTVTAPSTAGTDNLSFDLVNETNFWFANNTSCGFPSGVVSTSSLITINNYPTVNAGADVSTCPGGPVTLTGTSTLPAVVGPLSASGAMYDDSGTPVNLTLSGAPAGATITSITFTPILVYSGITCYFYNSWYLMQYWNGSAWVNITSCNTPITITNFNGNIVNGQILSIRPQDLDAWSDFVTLTLSNVIVSYQPGGTSPVTWSSSPAGYSSTTPTTIVTPMTTTTYTLTGNNNGCTSSDQVIVTVVDITAPTITAPTAVTVNADAASCAATGVNLGSPVTNDNCSVASVTNDGPSSYPLGNTTVTWLVTDGSGNTATTTQVVTVIDNQNPTITAPSAVTVNNDLNICTASGVALGSPMYNDNCSVASVVNNAPAVYPLGNTTVTWTVTDGSGLSTSATQIVTVLDVQNPVAHCHDTLFLLDALGSFTATGAMVNNISVDNCSISSYTLNQSTFTCADIGTNPFTMTVTDGSGNTNTCVSMITVQDIVPPSAICQNITAQLDALGLVSISAAQVDNGSNDACGIATTTINNSNFNCSNLGANTVTLTVTDLSGNVSTCTSTVTVADTISPLFIVTPASITNTAVSGICGRVINYALPTYGDNCTANMTQIDNTGFTSGDIFPVGVTTQTYEIVDQSGNNTLYSFTITIVDNQNPIITNCPANISVGTSQNSCNAVVNWTAPAISDNCPGVQYTVSNASGSTFTAGSTTVTYTATDASTNTSTCSFTVTVTDNIAPVVPTLATVTGSCSVTVTPPTTTDNCSGVITGTASTPLSYSIPGTNVITWTFTDIAGNSSTANQTVIVQDNVFPTITAPAAMNTTANTACTATGVLLGTPITADDCSVASVTNNAPAAFNLGTTTVIWTVTDASGNATNATQLVTVIDNVNPTITAPAAVNVNANNACSAFSVTLGTPVTSDNCSVASVTNNAPATFAIGSTTVTWTVTDGSGLTATATQTVTVVDATNPTIVAPANITANASATCSVTGLNLGTPVAADNCSVASVTHNAPVTFNIGNTTVTWTVTDASGNTATATQTITVIDNIFPTITAPAAINTTTNTACTATGVVLGTPVTADNCSVASVTNNAPATFNLGTTTVTWTVTDASGNATNATQLVSVTDNVNPTITAPAAVSVNANNACSAFSVALGTPVTSDNCSVASVTNNAPATFAIGSTTVTWTVTDGSGLTATATQTVTVVDATNPTIVAPANITANASATCSVTGLNLGTPVAADNCSVASVTHNAPVTFNIGNTTVTWTVTDASGNTATATQTITVIDNIFPTITAPAAINTTTNTACTATGVVLGTPVTADNCSVASVTNNAPATFNLGTTTVTWTVTDASGNATNATQLVSVIDNVNPTITAPAAVNATTNNGCMALNVALGTPVTTDNCSIASVTHNAPNAFNVGITVVTWTITDGSGNTATATQNVTITDVVAPIVIAPQNINSSSNTSCTATGLNIGTAIALDNCTVASITSNAPAAFPVGTTIVTWSATDNSGNIGTATQTVTIIDNIYPSIIPPNDLTAVTNSGCTADNLNLGTPITSDNCGVAFVTNNAPSAFAVGETFVTWTVIDVNGNSTNTIQKVTITDDVAPILIPSANITVFANNSCNAFNVNLGNPVVSDNCGIASLVNDGPTVYDLGTTTVNWTVTDNNGNVVTASQTVTVIDNQIPTIIPPASLMLSTNNACVASNVIIGNAITNDNCTVASVINDAPVDFPVGTTIITWTVTDASGNTNTGTQTITVTDDINPTPVLQNITVILDLQGNAVVAFNDVDAGSFDNCGIATTSLSQTNFDCGNIGQNVLTVTITDNNGNTSVANITLTVETNGIDTDLDGIDDSCDDIADPIELFIPEAFTPNGNNINDLFVIRNLETYNTKNLEVFNRYGNRVYSSGNYQNDWDGSRSENGQALPDGTYYYVLTLTDNEIFRGYVYINRVKQ